MQPDGIGARIEAVLLDLDGTLVDTLGDFVAALQATLVDLPPAWRNVRVTRALVETLVGKGSEHLVASLLVQSNPNPHEPVSQEIQALALARYLHHYQHVNGQYASVYAGVTEGMVLLQSRGWPLACVTNKPTGMARDLLQKTDLLAYFKVVLGGDAVARKKPDPIALLLACAELGVSPAYAVMVGDSSNDAQAARAAGCPVWLMTYGYNHGQPVRAVDADGFADSLAALPWLRG